MSNCATCDISTTCLTCKPGYWLQLDKKTCLTQFFFNSLYYLKIKYINFSKYKLNKFKIKLLNSCPTGQYKKDGMCYECNKVNSLMLQCTACNNETYCSSCGSSYTLRNDYTGCISSCSSDPLCNYKYFINLIVNI